MVQYGKFVLDDLFSITGTKSTDAGKVSFVKNGDAQFVGRTSAGYGIQGMVNSADMGFDPNEANTISVSQVGTIVAQYRDFPYYTSQNITKFSADFLNPEVGLYFCGIINDWLGKAGFVGYHAVKQRDLKKQVVLLPVTPAGEPDFEYMTMRIRELEAERIRELEAYLRVTGLADTTLSASEAQALTQDVKWKKFKIGDLFEKADAKFTGSNFDVQHDVSKIKDDEFNLPVVSVLSDHNGIMYYGRSSDWSYVNNSIDIVQNGIKATGSVFYQSQYTSSFRDAYLVKFKDRELTQEESLYMVGALKAVLPKSFSRERLATWTRVKNAEFSLPVTPDDQIDFNYMQDYIRATEKQTIKGAVEYKDRVIKETKKVVDE